MVKMVSRIIPSVEPNGYEFDIQFFEECNMDNVLCYVNNLDEVKPLLINIADNKGYEFADGELEDDLLLFKSAMNNKF